LEAALFREAFMFYLNGAGFGDSGEGNRDSGLIVISIPE
jgi:hypothetical protein